MARICFEQFLCKTVGSLREKTVFTLLTSNSPATNTVPDTCKQFLYCLYSDILLHQIKIGFVSKGDLCQILGFLYNSTSLKNALIFIKEIIDGKIYISLIFKTAFRTFEIVIQLTWH